MKFDDGFSKRKSQINKEKHGVDFIEARMIWLDSELVNDSATTKDGELRMATIGKMHGKLWVAIWCDEGNGIKLLSAHRCEGTKFERWYYGWE